MSAAAVPGFTPHEQKVYALHVLHTVREVVRSAVEHRLLDRVQWIDQDETLADRLDSTIAEIEQLAGLSRIQARGLAHTVYQVKAALRLAERTGALRSTLWAPDDVLLDRYLDTAVRELLERSEPDGAPVVTPETSTDAGSTAVQYIAAMFGVVGALLLAVKVDPAWGFAAFLVSNIGWIRFSTVRRHWGLLAQQLAFLLTSVVGLWNFWLGPLVLG